MYLWILSFLIFRWKSQSYFMISFTAKNRADWCWSPARSYPYCLQILRSARRIMIFGNRIDIAFTLGILSLLGSKVPTALKVFLTALAVIDDLGAIITIALFYTKTLFLDNLFIALSIFIVLLVLNWLKVKNLIPYLIGGILMRYFMLHSGIHATITGVLLAFAIPFGK